MADAANSAVSTMPVDTPPPHTQQALTNTANCTHLKQRRARSQLSCIPCRQGKLKCNRSHDPACDQCIKRSRESSCVFVPPPVKQKPTQNVKGRIRQLEDLVVDLMKQQLTTTAQQEGDSGSQGERNAETEPGRTDSTASRPAPFSQPNPPSDDDASAPNGIPVATRIAGGGLFENVDIDGAAKPFGRMRISRDEITYVGDTHWKAILNGISELKRELGDEEEDGDHDGNGEATSPGDADNSTGTMGDNVQIFGNAFGNVPLNHAQPNAATGLGFMLGNTDSLTRQQLIASVPPKKVADRLLSLWFNSPDPFKPIIHAPTFQEEYRHFWRSPNETPTMWLGLLFAILSLAASFGLRDCDPTTANARAILQDVNRYHTLSASSAVLADFTKPKQYTIECLLLYAAGLRSNDAFVNVWLMIGLILRLTLRMGYHRDPANYPAISIFNGEMRRRVWAIVSMIDVLISFQLGLPSMVKTLQSDTAPPRNLLDRDFNVDTKTLPPSRGIDELTPCSYTRVKLRIVRIFADASELTHTTVQTSHENMMELDSMLEEARMQVPSLLQMPDISELVTDPAEQLMCRFNIDLLYLKTKIVLHRRYMEKPFAQLSPKEQTMGIGYSRRACISCALRVLQHHSTIYSASQSGGQLESVKWYMGSISTHDFLLASMVICLELSQQIGSNAPYMNPSGHMCQQRAAMMNALERSQKIWSDASGRKRRPNQFEGKDEHARGEHMFDETEKASRAMAVMLEKVKATFPRQATALAQFNEVSTPAQPSAYMSGALNTGTPATFYGGMNANVPFGGVVSFHQWNNMTGVPDVNNDGPYATSGLSGNGGSNSNSQPDSNNISPERVTEFSMIGEMLDMQGNIDWEMFDTGMNKAQQQDWYPLQQESQHDPFRLGVPSGGEDLPIAGNAIIGGGTGPGSGREQYPGSWLSFHDMDDVNFDINGAISGDGTSNQGGFFMIPDGMI